MQPKDNTKQGTKYTPFFMVYGSEAVLPTDLEYGSLDLKRTTSNQIRRLKKTRSTSLRRLKTWPFLTPPDISRNFDVTTTSACARGT